jgi:hypothetical protein
MWKRQAQEGEEAGAWLRPLMLKGQVKGVRAARGA